MSFVDRITARAQALAPSVLPEDTGELGFGSDLSCVDDCSSDFAEVSGLQVLAESLIRSVTTPRGTVIDAPAWGIDVRAALNHGMTTADFGQLAGRIQSQFEADDRVLSADVTVTPEDPLGTAISCTATVTTRDPSETFNLVFRLSDSDVSLDSITA